MIALGGIKHTGKSTVGKILCEELSVPFQDLDHLIMKILPPRWTIRKWFREKGAAGFMNKERDALKAYLQDGDDESIRILALGGGTLENPEALALLREYKVPILVLNEEADVLYRRIILNGIPPFLDKDHPEESFKALYKKRTKTLLSQGDHIINIHGLDQQQSAEQVIRIIRSQYGG